MRKLPIIGIACLCVLGGFFYAGWYFDDLLNMKKIHHRAELPKCPSIDLSLLLPRDICSLNGVHDLDSGFVRITFSTLSDIDVSTLLVAQGFSLTSTKGNNASEWEHIDKNGTLTQLRYEKIEEHVHRYDVY